MLDKDTDLTGDGDNVTYTYTVADAKAEAGGTAATGNTDIAVWTPDTKINGKELGDATASAWVITVGKEGGIVGINATW